jgi:hypothetical protein
MRASLIPPRDRPDIAGTGERAANARRSEFDRLRGFAKPKSATLGGRNVASLSAATPVPPTPWPLVPREPTGLLNGGRALLTVGPRRCAAPRPVGDRPRSGRHAQRRAGRHDGASGPPARADTRRPPAFAARRQRRTPQILPLCVSSAAGASIAGCFLRKFTQIRKCFPSDAGYVARRRTRMRAPLTLRRI